MTQADRARPRALWTSISSRGGAPPRHGDADTLQRRQQLLGLEALISLPRIPDVLDPHRAAAHSRDVEDQPFGLLANLLVQPVVLLLRDR